MTFPFSPSHFQYNFFLSFTFCFIFLCIFSIPCFSLFPKKKTKKKNIRTMNWWSTSTFTLHTIPLKICCYLLGLIKIYSYLLFFSIHLLLFCWSGLAWHGHAYMHTRPPACLPADRFSVGDGKMMWWGDEQLLWVKTNNKKKVIKSFFTCSVLNQSIFSLCICGWILYSLYAIKS